MTLKIARNFIVHIDGWKFIAIIATVISSTWGAELYYSAWKTDKMNQAKEIHATYVLVNILAKHDTAALFYRIKNDSTIAAIKKFDDSVRSGMCGKCAIGFETERKDKRGKIHLQAVN